MRMRGWRAARQADPRMAGEAVVEDQSAVIEALSRPEAFGLPAGEPVRRIDTHAAAIFLAGDRAYKLKRAVLFPFLDFSTAARRAAMCAAEISLNRRTAPDLYLGAAPVEPMAGGGYRVGAVREPRAMAGAPAEWLVVMRRFPDDATLDVRADRGLLDPALIDALAATVARFHADAPRRPGYGTAAIVREAVDTDVAMLRRQAAWLDPALNAEIAAGLPAAAARHATLIDGRSAAGAVRHCHGDLHLGNICLLDGRPVPFDAIEFNDRLAHIDVLYDLAFLLMDLDRRGLGALANRLLNRYLWLSADPDRALAEGLALLPLFLSRRAAIRAHVGAAGIALQKTDAQRAALQEEVLACQRHAAALLRPCPAVLLAVGGLSGSGKSTLAAALAPAIGARPGAVVLRSDVLRKRRAGVALDQPMPAGSYGREAGAAVYAEMMALAETLLRAGRGVILDAVFADPAERAAAAAVARRAGVAFAGLWLEAPAAVMESRIAGRAGDASDATPAVLRRQLDYALGAMDWHRVEAGGAPGDTLARARAMLAGLAGLAARPDGEAGPGR